MNGQKELADALGRYADVVTAFAFGESIAFAAGMWVNDGFARAVHDGFDWAIGFTVVSYIIYFGFLSFSRRGIAELQRGEVALSAIAVLWTNRIWRFRRIIVGLSLIVTIAGFVLPPFQK